MSWANWPTWTSRCGRAEIDLDAFDPTGQSAELAASDRRVRGNLAVLRDWAARPAGTAGRRLAIRFWLRPAAIEGTPMEGTGIEGAGIEGPGRVSGLTVERTRLDEQGRVTGTGEYETIPAQMVFRSVGYQSVPLDGVPFDENTATVPHDEGRVLGPDGAPLPGEYVAGWLKRGPTGVVGTNKSRCGRDRPVPAGRPGCPWRRAAPQAVHGGAGRARGASGELCGLAPGGDRRGGTGRRARPR